VHLELKKEEEAEAIISALTPHAPSITPSSFLVTGLDLEEQQ
jgi:hypothetical protein